MFNIKFAGFSMRKNFVGFEVITMTEYDLLGCNSVQFGEPDISEEHIVSIFRVEECVKKKPGSDACLGCFVALLTFDPEDGSDIFLLNNVFCSNYRRFQPEGHTDHEGICMCSM
jgi:hypothetical protein